MKNLLKSSKKKTKSNEVIRKVTNNLNNTKTAKYQIEPEEVEKKALSDDVFREKYDFYRLRKVGTHANRLERYDIKKDIQKPKKLREPLEIGENVLVLAERLKKKDAPGSPYFNKKIFIIKKRVKTISDNWYYWLSEENSDIVNKHRYISQELYALNQQWK